MPNDQKPYAEELKDRQRGPGTPIAIIDAMFAFAERECGHDPASSRHALTTIINTIEALREHLADTQRLAVRWREKYDGAACQIVEVMAERDELRSQNAALREIAASRDATQQGQTATSEALTSVGGHHIEPADTSANSEGEGVEKLTHLSEELLTLEQIWKILLDGQLMRYREDEPLLKRIVSQLQSVLAQLSTTREQLAQAELLRQRADESRVWHYDKAEEARKERDTLREIAGELAVALEQMLAGEPWRYMSCHMDSPVKDCKLCGRYYDAKAALAKAKAAGISSLDRATETKSV